MLWSEQGGQLLALFCGMRFGKHYRFLDEIQKHRFQSGGQRVEGPFRNRIMDSVLDQQRVSKYPNAIRKYVNLLVEIHERSGLSLRDVARASDLDPTYVHYILKGARRPRRDVIIALGFGYALELWEVDEILLTAGMPPIGRGALRAYREANKSNRT